MSQTLRVPVLDSRKKPLMPTTAVRARLLLKSGKAKPYWNHLGIFCIILTKEVEPNNQIIAAAVDPGSKFEAFSVVGIQDTIVNAMTYAPTHIKEAVEVRRNMRRARRHRNLRRRPARFNNRLRNTNRLPPSTKARWQSKLNILKQLSKVIPISDVVVEDVRASPKKHARRWNVNFSPIEVGKQWFYQSIKDLGFKLWLKNGWDTKTLRSSFGFKKTSQKAKVCWESHVVDSWVMAASITGAKNPCKHMVLWTPLWFHRRQLHVFQAAKGGVRKLYGGTRSMGLTRGTLVQSKWGLCYVGGTSKGKVSLHSLTTGKRVCQNADPVDLLVKTKLTIRRQAIPLTPKGASILA
jgi:hypothetical protein